MTDRDQIDAFAGDLDKLVERYAQEFNLSTAAAVGVLTIKIHHLLANKWQRDEDEE